ncbi:MAG TPA: NAD(P)H-dependent oxidoreductase [Thermotogota bacterium]|nr:NAD(P)H-dependent oxidoreductase [Thermotogota bacterium]
MSFLAINGSPRGKVSNTHQLITYFTKAMSPSFYKIVHLKEFYNKNQYDALIEEMKTYESILIGFPLYADWTPGYVKELFEKMGERRAELAGKKYLYLIQCGFPESHHCRYVARYCARFTDRIGGVSIGSIVRGNSEGARLIPETFFKDSKILGELGRIFETETRLDQGLLEAISKPEKLTKSGLTRIALMQKLPLGNGYWNSQLKKNGAFEKRFDKPYEE